MVNKLNSCKKWLKYHGKKLATAAVAVILAVVMVVGLQPAGPVKALQNSVT